MRIDRENVREYISRHFFGKVAVRRFPLDVSPPPVAKLRTSVKVMSGHSRARVLAAVRLTPSKLSCSSGQFRIRQLVSTIHGERVAKYASGEIRVRGLKLKIVPEVKEDRKRVSRLPQERQNRLNFLSSERRSVWENEIVLAYFSPIVMDDVVKIALNKQRGTLFLWYNAKGRHFDAKGLFMCKRFGAKESQWHWV
jgi:hypothetical protein